MGSDSADEPGRSRAGQYSFIDLSDTRSEKVHALHDYWQSIRGDREMPRREDVDPTAIWSLVKNTFVVEWHTGPDRVFYRIAGTELVAALGVEIRGKWLTDLYSDPQDIARTLWLYRHAVASRVPVFGRTVGTEKRIGAKTFEWIVCPLSQDGENVTHFIGLEDYVASRRYLGDPD